MIRNKLYEYHSGKMSLEDIRNYTQSKYEDGVLVYSNLLYALRTDLDGNIIAEYNTDL